MGHILPLNLTVEKMSDIELEKNFVKKPVILGKQNYYPVFAKRIDKFKDFLFSELIDVNNIDDFVMGGVTTSWLIAIAILDYSDNELYKADMVTLIKQNWDDGNLKNFLNYIKNEEQFIRYFK
ncbi:MULTISPECIES: hypothetical protein [unclassified Chryseobacterium]|uniref:hypothetical protein n=1 Tax=unclassified Chryseobacterium TaxID=2593645 RepID=UPI001AE5D9B6|nr:MULTISPECIES: hypothetical protein [unclassified Chryseobacterium]MBP1166429.1 hypothetical protein [Chryseobacterium sp. PvR013]MDR4891620.1 hypothetical protein [Chryseobacterium sp. CFS7]